MSYLFVSRRVASKLLASATTGSATKGSLMSLSSGYSKKARAESSKTFLFSNPTRSLFTDTPRSNSSEKPSYIRMKELALKKDVNGVRQLLDELKASQPDQIDIKIYNPIIHMFHDMKNSEAVLQLYEDLQSRDLTPDEPTYNRIMYALINAKRQEDSIELYQKMTSKGIKLSSTAPDLFRQVESWIDHRRKH